MSGREEQDLAAGGRECRMMRLAGGSLATVSIELKHPHPGRAVWAYLRWFEGGRTRNRYIGRVSGDTRLALLSAAWRLARERDLLAGG